VHRTCWQRKVHRLRTRSHRHGTEPTNQYGQLYRNGLQKNPSTGSSLCHDSGVLGSEPTIPHEGVMAIGCFQHVRRPNAVHRTSYFDFRILSKAHFFFLCSHSNSWKVPTDMISVQDSHLRGGGGSFCLKMWDSAKDIISEWTGQELAYSSLYGVRVYKEGSILAPHVGE
jgi:hypothetical protein